MPYFYHTNTLLLCQEPNLLMALSLNEDIQDFSRGGNNTLPAKIWNIFYFSNFLHFVGRAGCFCT